MTALNAPASEATPSASGTEQREGAVPVSRRALDIVYGCVFAAVGLAIGVQPLSDNSFLWHVRTGELILDQGIPRHDPYSFTAPGVDWVAQSWLAELLYGIVERVGGGFGLRLLGGVTGAFVAVMLFWIARRLSGDRLRGGSLCALALLVMLNVWSERPLMFGIAAMVALVACVELPSTWLGRRPLVTLPVLFWLWANVHGTFAIGFGYLTLHLIGRALEGYPASRDRERALLRGGLLGVAVTALNPYFLDLPLFPLRLLGRGTVLDNVSEWQSPDFGEVGGQLFAAWLVVLFVLLVRRSAGARDLLISVAFTLLGLWAVRNVGLAAIATVPIAARLVARQSGTGAGGARPFDRVLAMVAVCSLPIIVLQAAGVEDWDLERYPVDAYAAIESQDLAGRRLATTDAWGGYLIGTEWPQQRVFFDDRYDMYPIALQRDYDALATVKPEWLEVLDRYRIEIVMWPVRSAIVQALSEREDWTRVYDDKTAAVFVREDADSRP